MPELPEVETIKRTLEPLIVGKIIARVEVIHPGTIIGDPVEFKNVLKDKAIVRLERRGKYLIFHLSCGLIWISHLRMEGKYFFVDEETPRAKHDMVVFHFLGGKSLVYNDMRRFGRMKLGEENDYLEVPPLDKIGPDPFEIEDARVLYEAWRHKMVPVKGALLSQEVMSGLGNIYADEILFQVRLHPETPTRSIGPAKWEEILLAAKDILGMAIAAGGSTIRSYHPAQGIDGRFQLSLKAYGKAGTPCPVCGTTMEKIRVSGRGSTFCPKCQKNPSRPFVIGLTGPVASGKSRVARMMALDERHVFDADEKVRDLYADPSFQRVVQSFFVEDVSSGGEIDKKLLLELMLKHPDGRKRLEELVSGSVRLLLKEYLTGHRPHERVVLEIARLYEGGFSDFCDAVVYVDAKENLRRRRLRKRGADVERIMALNAALEFEKDRARADAVIENDGTIGELRRKVRKCLAGIRRRRSGRTP